MVIGLFCHYLPIYKDVNGNYCSTTMTDDLFNRYFCVVDKLFVATRVYPISETYEEAHQELINTDRVEIIEFPNLSTPKGMITLLSAAKKKVLKYAKEADLIFIRGGIIALLGVDAAKKLNKPYLVECGGCAWDEYWNYSFVGKLMAPYMEYREIKMVKEASHVIYVTEKWLQKRYPTDGVSTVASNVILTDVDETALSKRKNKVIEFDNKGLIRIGTTGGIGNKAKGQQFVIEAMSRLRDRYDIVYELVGGGDNSFLRQTAEKYGMQDKVLFLGQKTHEEVLNWIDNLDFYIQPSMQEGLPRALIEAMSRACPAIGSTTAGIPELLQDEYTFKRGSVRDLIRVLDYAFKHDATSIAEMNFNKSKEFQIDILNDRRTELYKDFLKTCKDI